MMPGKQKRYHNWKVGQINIQSCSDDMRLDLALQECVQANLDIICFQEVRRLGSGSINHLGYDFYWCGFQRYKKYGVGIALKNNPNIKLDSIHNVSSRLMAADVTVCGCKLRIISCYAPTLQSSLTTKQSFYRDLTNLSKTEKNRKLLIQGDFNAELQISRQHSCFDGRSTAIQEGLNQINENSMLFLQYCQRNQLSILNTWFSHPIHHRVTWHHPNGITKKVYDYSLSRSWLRRFIHDVRVRNSYFNSDHRLVITKLHTPANKSARNIRRKMHVRKLDLQLLHDDQATKMIVQRTITENLDNIYSEANNINEMHSNLIDILKKGREKIPTKPKENHTIPWNQDEELAELFSTRKQLRNQKVTNYNQAKIKELTKKIKVKVKIIRNQILKTKGQSINQAKIHRKIAKLWKDAKNHDRVIFRKPKPIQCPGLTSYFKDHFNPDHSTLLTPSEIQNPPEYIQALKDLNPEINQLPPTPDEISKAIKQLNMGKSTIDVETEIIKCAESIPQFKDQLEKYYKEIWTKREVPEQWRITRITPIWKNKGSASDPTKYRGISIGSILSKVGMNIILQRISSFYESQLKLSQFGFRKGVGCSDGIYVIKQLHEIASLSQRELFVCYIDLTAAFDHVDRKLLFKTVKNRLPPNSTNANIAILENLYSDTRSFLQNDKQNNAFPTSSGVRQGGTEGPPLYNLYSDYTLRVYDNRKTQAGVEGLNVPYFIPHEATNREQRSYAPSSGTSQDDDVGYADDLGVFAWSQEELQICINILANVFEEFGLEINLDKTKTMIINFTTTTDNNYPESIICINNKTIENTPSFKYLGVWITYNKLSIGNEELEHRINSAHIAFSENRKLLTNMNVGLQTRMMFLNALVRSRLTYGCHCWRPNAQELSKIQSTYHYFLRCMVYNGHKRVNPPARQASDSASSTSSTESSDDDDVDWSYKITNKKLLNITCTESIKQFYEKQQHNFVAHIIRRENNNIAKNLMFHNVVRTKRGRKSPSILESVIERSGLERSEFLKASFLKTNQL